MGLFLVVIAVLAVLAPILPLSDPAEIHATARLAAPSKRYFFGTDELGRDLFSRVIYGSRISCTIGLSAMLFSLLIGVPLGLAAGFAGKWADILIGRFLDGLLAFPGVLLALAIIASFGANMTNLVLAIGIVGVPSVARVTRSKVLVEREKDYVLAARVVGRPEWQIAFTAVLLNSLSPIIVQGSLATATAILAEASLSFLGLGVQPPNASWGSLLQSGYSYISKAPWYGLFPGLAVFITVLALNVIGDALQDRLDPRLRQR